MENKPAYKLHPSAIYTSRLLDFKNLPEPQNSKEINEKFYKLVDSLEDLRITDIVKFSEELEKQINKLQIKEKSQKSLLETNNKIINSIHELESEEIPPIEVQEKRSTN